MTTRSSATAIPVAPSPTEIHSFDALLVAEEAPQAVVECPAQPVGAGLQDVEDRALPADEAARELDDLLEDLGRISQGGDAGGDLAQGLFRSGPAGERAAGPVELLEELGPGDRDSSLRGDRLEQAGIGLAPRVGARGEDRQGAERTGLPDQRRGHHRVDAEFRHVRIAAGPVREAVVGGVIARPDGPRLDHRLAGDALLGRFVGIDVPWPRRPA